MIFAARLATFVLTLTAFGLLVTGVVYTIYLLFQGAEGQGFAAVLIWPLTWLVFGVLCTAALWAADRIREGILYLLALLVADILLWTVGNIVLFIVVSSLLGDTIFASAVSVGLVVCAFDIGAIYVAWRFLLQGGPNTILGR